MDMARRRRFFGDLLSEERLNRTEPIEIIEIEDATVKELSLPVVSCTELVTHDTDALGRIKFE